LVAHKLQWGGCSHQLFTLVTRMFHQWEVQLSCSEKNCKRFTELTFKRIKIDLIITNFSTL
jgi:hypothetical protein